MLQSKFLCPQCHQDMSNAEMLQTHLQNVHMKQSSSTIKGLFSLAKQKFKVVQDNPKTPPIGPPKIYAQYFSRNSNENYSKQQYFGYGHSYNEYFKSLRKNKLDQICTITKRSLLRMELLINTNDHIPRNGNTKERQKYEQNIVAWMEDSITSMCASCSKSFGLFGRKHHCRLDGRIICNPCSRFISFSNARWILELNALLPSSTMNDITLKRLINLISIISSTIINDGSNEDYVRICLPCGQFLQKHYDIIRFKNIENDEIPLHYNKIVQIKKECHHILSTYPTIIESLLSGDTKYQIIDAQRMYQQLNTYYDKIDSASRSIAKLADSSPENDKRYIALCRNIRTYSMQVVQNYSRLTKRVPSKDDIKRVCDQRIGKLTLNSPEKIEPLVVKQPYQIIQFIQQDKLNGRDDEIVFLELNISK